MARSPVHGSVQMMLTLKRDRLSVTQTAHTPPSVRNTRPSPFHCCCTSVWEHSATTLDASSELSSNPVACYAVPYG